jgi:hypothetical protein
VKLDGIAELVAGQNEVPDLEVFDVPSLVDNRPALVRPPRHRNLRPRDEAGDEA